MGSFKNMAGNSSRAEPLVSAVRLFLCTVVAAMGCRCPPSDTGGPDGGLALDAGGFHGAPAGPVPPFLRLLDVGGVADAKHDIWLWSELYGQPNAMRVEGFEGAENVGWWHGQLCGLLNTGRIRCVGLKCSDTDAGMRRCVLDVTKVVPLRGLDGEFREMNGDCLIKKDASVWCWRYVEPVQRDTELVQQTGLDHVAHFAGSCALLEDGTVSCSEGEWVPPNKWVPPKYSRIRGLNDVVEIAGHGVIFGRGSYETAFTCARKRDGTVWCWGNNDHAQLGVMKGLFHAKPVQVPGIDDARAIAVSARHACALRGDGHVWCWGAITGTKRGPTGTCPPPSAITTTPAPRCLMVAAAGWCSVRAMKSLSPNTPAARHPGPSPAWRT